MLINNDLTSPAYVNASELDWISSPTVGVDRKMLYREGVEVARATSIVRYAPESSFPSHVHGGGEEILVLQGTFQDEQGDFPAGSYFRNPPGTAHTPASLEGCTILVRLWQFREGDNDQIACDPEFSAPTPVRDGAQDSRLLFDDGAERVSIDSWAPDASIAVPNARGLEFFVLDGDLRTSTAGLTQYGWGRLPAGMPLHANVGPQGARIWIKEAPLQHPDILRIPT